MEEGDTSRSQVYVCDIHDATRVLPWAGVGPDLICKAKELADQSKPV